MRFASSALALFLVLMIASPSICFADDDSIKHNRIHHYSTFQGYDRFLREQDFCTEFCCQQYMMNYSAETVSSDSESKILAAVPFPAQIALIMLLLFVTAAFAGLTLGLMGLDNTGLEIIMHGDNDVNAERARRIYPFRQRGNLLLCTLVLGNIASNSLLSILMADKAGGLVGFLSATFLIVIFGEIIPQAACSRYSLMIGSASIPLVRIVLFLLYPVAYPLSWLLDKVLGAEIATTYSSAELMKLLQIHVTENALDPETAIAMTGALKYKNLAVKDVMTPIDRAFMLSVDDKLNYEMITRIFKTGYSGIPVYKADKNNVIGLLFVKDLIFIDPDDETPVKDVIEIFGRSTHVATINDTLGDVLRELKKGDEIVDETDAAEKSKDAYEDRDEKLRWARLSLFNSKIVEQKLSPDETRAVSAHLSINYPAVVADLTEHQLHQLVAETPVATVPVALHKVGQSLPGVLLYEKNKKTDFATLILTGKVTVESGVDKFRTDMSNWSLLGRGALQDARYAPDFSAFVSVGPCRCIFLKRANFSAAVKASARERQATKKGGRDSSANEATALLDQLM
ncbi:hypothetical protein MPSEU_000322000 [Mayamaea pseudoterrestris]|nr:hypothetical protein MPSEU_000322000 [Mayamaea pseudoterrestris]